jgi:hypothetical protein
MSTWSEFVASAPELATPIRELLYQYGRGMAYLATIRRDGGPRLHPVSPIVTGDGLYCFVVASPKRDDLFRDGRYALHTFPGESSDAEALLTGSARQVMNVSIVDSLARSHSAAPGVDWTLFELSVESAMLHRYAPGASAVTWRSRSLRPLLVAA